MEGNDKTQYHKIPGFLIILLNVVRLQEIEHTPCLWAFQEISDTAYGHGINPVFFTTKMKDNEHLFLYNVQSPKGG